MSSVAKRELKVMQAAGWTVVSYGPWERLRALFGRRRPVGRVIPPRTETSVSVPARVHLPRSARWSEAGAVAGSDR